MKKILEGLQILSKYSSDSDFSAEHDQIWCGENIEMSTADLEKLEKLGWFLDEEVDSWSHFC